MKLANSSAELRNDKDVVMAALEEAGGEAFKYATKDIILWAVNFLASNLQSASEDLRNDKDVVTVGVRQDGMALEWASRYLKNYPEVVRAAVK